MTLLIFVLFSITVLQLSRACFTPREVPDYPPTTPTSPSKCRDCTFESLLEPVTDEYVVQPKNYTKTTTPDGCTAFTIICGNDNVILCDYWMIITNRGSDTGTTLVSASKVDEISFDFTCNDSGMFNFEGSTFNELYCYEFDCQ